MSKPLTAAAAAKLRPTKARREIPDGSCPGLYLIIQPPPSGAKSWALRYRRPSGKDIGKPAKLMLGSAHLTGGKEHDAPPVVGGHLSLAAARRLTTELRHQIAQGRDVAELHQEEKERRRTAAVDATANSFGGAAVQFVEQYAARRIRRWREVSRLIGVKPADLTIIRKSLADRWAERPVSAIDGHDIHNVVDEARRFGIPGLKARVEGMSEARARKMYSALSGLFAWLMRSRRVVANPCVGVSRPETPRSRDRALSNSEIVKLWRATASVAQPVGAAVKLLLLTGSRLNEIAALRWDEISEDGAELRLPGSRTKNHKPHIVPLSKMARDIIASLPRFENSRFVFTTNGARPINSWGKTKLSLDAAMGDAPPWTLHDLRRTAATGMAEIGIAPHIVEACLNHISGARAGVAGVYNRATYAPEKKAALEHWTNHVERLVAGKASKNVVALRG